MAGPGKGVPHSRVEILNVVKTSSLFRYDEVPNDIIFQMTDTVIQSAIISSKFYQHVIPLQDAATETAGSSSSAQSAEQVDDSGLAAAQLTINEQNERIAELRSEVTGMLEVREK